jgi:HD superfamily phosphodiesterase
MNEILNEARNYLVEFLRGKQLQIETQHPWRKAWEFVVLHSLRVEGYVVQILEREPTHLSDTEFVLLRLAAIVHDIGRLEITENHAKLGAEIIEQWLTSNHPSQLTDKQKKKVVDLIAAHSEKGLFEKDLSTAVLKDADTLDEIGVMSIFMTSNWIDHQSPYFFHELLKRLQEFEIPFCEEKMALLNTAGAREILAEKQAFIETFIVQLEVEIGSDHHIESLLR